jgi:hypothetical protein
MFLCCEPSYYLIQLLRYDQVLTGIVPYEDSGFPWCFGHDERPSRPTDPSQNQWLQDPVWDMIVTCWSAKPEQRCELSVMHRIFSTSSLRDARPDKQGDLNVQNNRNFTIAEKSQPLKQGYSKVENSSDGLPLSFDCYEIQSQKSRGLSMKWTR